MTMKEGTNIVTGPQVIAQYASAIGKKKAESPAAKLFLLGILSGLIIAFGAVGAATASHAIANPGVMRLVSGVLFPFGLGMVMLTGVELFTGNTMIFISVLDRQASAVGLLKNWFWVYFGNMTGSMLLAAAVVYSGQLNLGGGSLVVFAIQVAVAKCSLAFGPALVLGILCNVLVCLGVLCSLTAKDTPGRIMGAFIPVSLFVISGFEHSIANMYYIPVAIWALGNPEYAALAAEAGLNTSVISWSAYVGNLIPVTIGNILGGAGVATVLWLGHGRLDKA